MIPDTVDVFEGTADKTDAGIPDSGCSFAAVCIADTIVVAPRAGPSLEAVSLSPPSGFAGPSFQAVQAAKILAGCQP